MGVEGVPTTLPELPVPASSVRASRPVVSRYEAVLAVPAAVLVSLVLSLRRTPSTP